MKNKRNIIGVIGNDIYKDIVVNILISKGFYNVNINDKVKEIAKLFELDNINCIRERGYKINRLYWINLALSSVAEDKKSIVISDIRLEDIIVKIMKVYYICDNFEENMPKYIETIYKNKNLEDFKEEVNEKVETLKILH